jgi:hypothetical protein
MRTAVRRSVPVVEMRTTRPLQVEESGRPFSRQAALTESRNLPTSSLRRLLSPDSDCAAERTCDEADPVSLAPRCTSVMFELTSVVPCAACWMLRDISWVAAPCCSTAAAMADDSSDNLSMVPLISLMAFTGVAFN